MRGTAASLILGVDSALNWVCGTGVRTSFKHRTKPTKIYLKNFDLKNMNQRDMWMCFHANTWRCAAINAQEHYTKRNPHSPILKKFLVLLSKTNGVWAQLYITETLSTFRTESKQISLPCTLPWSSIVLQTVFIKNERIVHVSSL